MNKILGWLLGEKPRSNPWLSLYFFAVIWGLSGRFEIASLRDAGVRSFSLTPDCRAEGLYPFGSLSGVIEFQPLLGCLTQIGLGI